VASRIEVGDGRGGTYSWGEEGVKKGGDAESGWWSGKKE
jgi:hypothetical protein